jgi:osmotically-inducible protein OsmY
MKTDSRIQQDVIDEFRWEPAVDATGIGVEVKDEIVALAGHVSNTHRAIFLKVLPAHVHCYCQLPW